MSNFQFLEPDFTSLAKTAKEAEKLTYISPQFSLTVARTSFENLVLWLYQYDKKLTQLYDSLLHNLLNDIKFKDLIPPYIWDKMDNICMVGNSAVHGKITNRKIKDHTDYKEDETRKLKIDLMLEEAGWDIGTTVREEVNFTGMPSPSGKGVVDYVLYDAKRLMKWWLSK